MPALALWCSVFPGNTLWLDLGYEGVEVVRYNFTSFVWLAHTIKTQQLGGITLVIH